MTLKYVDDLSILQALNLRNTVKEEVSQRQFPLNFNERTMHFLPTEDNQLQQTLLDLETFTVDKQMKIKERKTNLMKFNFSLKYDFPPELHLNGFKDDIEVVKEAKLLGIILTDDLKWVANTNYICVKAYKKIWILRRLKVLKVDQDILLDVYCKEIRSVLEVAVPAWHSGLNTKQIIQIERVQRVAVSVILGKSNIKYVDALELLGLEVLNVRRERLCANFALRTLKSRHTSMFEKNASIYNLRQPKVFKEHLAHTKRFFMSPLNYLTRLLNEV